MTNTNDPREIIIIDISEDEDDISTIDDDTLFRNIDEMLEEDLPIQVNEVSSTTD